MPYCGPNVEPVVVGETADCCPIYQCPCAMTDPAADDGGRRDQPALRLHDAQLQGGRRGRLRRKDVCGGPCTCQPAHGVCTVDSDCSSDALCDCPAAACRPYPRGQQRPTCEDRNAVPRSGRPTFVCSDGSKAGPTGRCLLNADGTCGWEVTPCPPDGCYGVCVPNIQKGCKADTDCPTGQECQVTCAGWGCSVGATTGGGSTGGSQALDRSGDGDQCCRRRHARVRRAIRRASATRPGTARARRARGSACCRSRRATRTSPKSLPDVRAGLPGWRHADSRGHRPETLLPDVQLPDVRPVDAGVDDGRNRHRLPGDALPVRQACRHRPGDCCPKYECGPVTPTGPARRGRPLSLTLSPLRGARGRISLAPRLRDEGSRAFPIRAAFVVRSGPSAAAGRRGRCRRGGRPRRCCRRSLRASRSGSGVRSDW